MIINACHGVIEVLYWWILKNTHSTDLGVKMIFWFHFHKLRYAHYRLSIVSLIAMLSFKTIALIKKAGETMKV